MKTKFFNQSLYFSTFCLSILLTPTVFAQPIQGSSGPQNAGGTAGVLGTSQIFNGVLGYTTANGHAGVAGACDEGMGNGIYGRSKNKNGVEGWSAAKPHSAVVGTNTGGGNGVLGVSNQGLGVHGLSVDDRGVYGQSAKSNGVLGVSKAPGHGGVAGVGANVGVYGKSEDPNGIAVWSDGKLTTKTVEILGGSDIAEHFNVAGSKTPIVAGTLMVIDEKNAGSVVPSAFAYDKKVVGVVSGANGVKTGMTLRQEGILEGDAVIAVTGRVYVKANDLSGAIQPGDFLTSSSVQGEAMKVVHFSEAQGAIIGKAMTPIQNGYVLMLISLQ